MIYGYAGVILRVDLCSGEIIKEPLELDFAQIYIGGLGFTAKFLFDETGPETDPYGPDNIVAVAPGALCGTNSPTANRTEATTKSPLTGIIGTGNFGGYWGPALKRAGYDAIVIKGISETPVYLWIDNDTVELRDASHLWGKDTFETTEVLRGALGDNVNVLSIGPAGENLVKYATLIADHYYAPGRSHTGAVCGTKKIKAIAVCGRGGIDVYNPDGLKGIRRDIRDRIERYPGFEYRAAVGAGSMGMYNPQLVKSAMDDLKKGAKNDCCLCPLGEHVGCTLTVDLKDGKYAGTKLVNASYTHYAQYVEALGIDFRCAWKIKELCNRFGMDSNHRRTAYPFRLYQKGIITKADTDGLALDQGNDDAVIELLRKIAYREGFGDILADGLVTATEKIENGAEKDLVTVKGAVATGTWDPREPNIYNTVRLGILTCPRGGDDLKNQHALVDFPSRPRWSHVRKWDDAQYRSWLLDWIDMFDDVKTKIFGSAGSPKGLTDLDEAMTTVWYGNYTCAYDALGLCMFGTTGNHIIGPTHFARIVSAVTGRDVTPQEMMQVGERIYNIMKAYNVREGLTRNDDHWPDVFYREPLGAGLKRLSKEVVDKKLDEYYLLRGWDVESGDPTQSKLVELGLSEVYAELKAKGFTKS